MSVAGTRNVRRPQQRSRRNVWLGIMAIVQAAVLAFVLLTVARPPSTKSGPLLGQGVQTSDITAFTVTGSGGASVTVKRDGTHWVLPDQGGYPAQDTRVKGFLQELTALQRSGLVATTKDAYKRLKVAGDTFQRKVALTLKSGKSETLYIGSEPSYGSTHVRLASDKGVYVTHSLHASDARTDAAGYVDPTAFKLNQSDVTRIEVKNQSGDFVFTKGNSGWAMQDVPGGKTFDPRSINGILSSFSGLQLNEPLGKTAKPAYGFATPLAVVTITTVSQPKSGSAASGTGSKAAAGTGSSGASPPGSATSGASAGGTISAAASSAGASSNGTSSGKAANGNAANGNAAASTSSAATSSSSSAGTASSSSSKAEPVAKTTTITVGAKDKDGFYPIEISGSPYIVRASGSSLGGVVDKKASDFFAKPQSGGKNGGGAGTSGATGGLGNLGGLGGAAPGGASPGQ